MSKVIPLRQKTAGRLSHDFTHEPAPMFCSSTRFGARLVMPLQVDDRGCYAGGYPEFLHRLYQFYIHNPRQNLDKGLMYLQDHTPYAFRLEKVTFTPLDDKTIPLKTAGKNMLLYKGQRGHLEKSPLKPEELQKKWHKVRLGLSDLTVDMVETHFLASMQSVQEIQDKLELAAACQNHVNEKDFPAYLQEIRESFMHDINQAFLQNYQDYRDSPDYSRRSFEYLGLHI